MTAVPPEGAAATTDRDLQAVYRHVRGETVSLCETLAPDDQVVQSMPDVSPTKWHLAHTTRAARARARHGNVSPVAHGLRVDPGRARAYHAARPNRRSSAVA